MQIGIAFDHAVMNYQSLWEEFISQKGQEPSLETPLYEEWLEYRNLASPSPECEDKINDWYDRTYKIRIIGESSNSNKKWLKSHYIPYDSIFPSQTGCDYYVVAKSNDAYSYASLRESKKVFVIKINNVYNTDKQEFLLNFQGDISPLEDKIIFCESWHEVFLNEKFRY